MSSTPSGIRPETRYVDTPHGNVAYQVFGRADAEARNIVFITSALTNLDAIWDEPSAARFLDRLGTMGRVVHFDMIGSGVSDPIPNRSTWLPIESNVADIRAVLDAADMPQVHVYGDVEGGFFAMMLAALDPGRVVSMALVNCMARVLRAPDYPIGVPSDAAETLSAMYKAQHGTTGALIELTAPSVADDPRFRTWFTRYQRLCVPLGLVGRTFDWFAETDVRAALPTIQAPTLVVTRRDARYHRASHGAYLADHIAGAQLIELEGSDSLPFHAGDFGPVLDAVEEFFTGRTEPIATKRMLATVFLSDIVGSTARASEMGDERWLDLLADHDRIVRSQLDRFGGSEVKMTGDGCLAVFDGPAQAIQCAIATLSLLTDVGVVARVGIHTGEIEVRDHDIGGVGVHIASRVMDEAQHGGVLVSSTVKDLVVGSGISFTEFGVHSLKGIPGEWKLYEVALGGA